MLVKIVGLVFYMLIISDFFVLFCGGFFLVEKERSWCHYTILFSGSSLSNSSNIHFSFCYFPFWQINKIFLWRKLSDINSLKTSLLGNKLPLVLNTCISVETNLS